MNSAFSIGASGLRSMQKQIDVHSANIANADTPGYRRRDPLSQAMLGGGVNTIVSHQFNAATAQRLSLLSGESSMAKTRSGALGEAADIIGASATDTAKASNAFNELLYRASLTPEEPGLREQLAASANALAQVANEGISALDKQSVNLSRDVNSTRELAKQKMDELATLNREAYRTGATPSLRDRQAQVGRELADLVGGEVRMEDNGTASFMLNNNFLVYGDNKRELPASTGGKLGGLVDSRQQVQGHIATLEGQLQSYADSINSLNASGVNGTGAAGGNLFEVSMGKLSYVGDSSGKAFSLKGPAGAASPAQAMADVPSLGESFLPTVVSSASNASSAQTTASSAGNMLSLADEHQQAQEGVDIDAEMIALKLAQRIYEANAKVIQTADSMLGTLLNMKA